MDRALGSMARCLLTCFIDYFIFLTQQFLKICFSYVLRHNQRSVWTMPWFTLSGARRNSLYCTRVQHTMIVTRQTYCTLGIKDARARYWSLKVGTPSVYGLTVSADTFFSTIYYNSKTNKQKIRWIVRRREEEAPKMYLLQMNSTEIVLTVMSLRNGGTIQQRTDARPERVIWPFSWSICCSLKSHHNWYQLKSVC